MMRVSASIAPIVVIPVAVRVKRYVWDEVVTMPETEVTAVVTKTVTTAKYMAAAKAVTITMSTAKPMSTMRSCQRNTRLQGERGKNGSCEP